MEDNKAETRKRLLLKSIREQDKNICLQTLWNIVKASARQHSYNDGFVEWFLVLNEFEDEDGNLIALKEIND